MVDLSPLFFVNISLTFLGILLIVIALFSLSRYIEILRTNHYHLTRWYTVGLLMILFLAGYAGHISILIFGNTFNIDPFFIVSLVYFAGAVFVIITIRNIERTIQAILGGVISDEVAISLFKEKFGEFSNAKLVRSFPLHCDACNSDVNYRIVDVVRNHPTYLERGIIIQSTFGVRSYILRTSHLCGQVRREISVIHDKDLEFRSIDQSRVLVGGEIA